MARAASAFVAVLLAGALVGLLFLGKPREVISSTPSAYTGLTVPLPLPAKGTACADEIAFDTDSEVARFGVTMPAGSTAPALRIVASGLDSGEYRSDYRATAEIPGGWTGARRFDVPLRPPGTSVFGTFCVENLGDVPIELVGTHNGRAAARPTVHVNGEQVAPELELRFLQRDHRSLLSRLGEITGRAATLKPFGGWWFWVLALLLLVGAPLALWRAIELALPDQTPAAAASFAWPAAGLRRHVAALPGWVLVAAVVAVAVVWFCRWSFVTHVFQGDEDQYVHLSRWLKTDFPASLFAFDAYGRGLQRLEVWLLAIPAALFDSPWSLRGGRALNALAFASTAIPVYLLGRRLELRPVWAALPAALSIAVPWAVVTTGFLTENVAYPAFVWAVWAIFRAATAPRWWRDLLALALLVVAGAARSGLLILVPVFPVVVAGVALRCGQGPLAARAAAALRQHIVLWFAVAIGVLALLAGPLGLDSTGLVQRLAGGYIVRAGFDPGQMLDKTGHYLARVFVGTGFFAAAVALPWLAVQAARSREPARFGFSLLTLLASVAMLYSLNSAGPDERYVLYLAPLVLLPATVAIARRELSPAGIAVASVLLALLLLRVPWNPEQGPFGHFVSPVEMFYARAVGLRLDLYLPGDAATARALATLALGAAGVALAAAARWRPTHLFGVTGAVIVAAVALSVLVQTQYTLSKYVNGAGGRAGATLSERAFVDRLVPRGQSVGAFAEGVGRRPDFYPIWQEVQFYNQQIDTLYALGENDTPVPDGDAVVRGVRFDPRTGRVSSPEPLPEYMTVPLQIGAARLRGQLLAAPTYIPVGLVRLAKPAVLDWSAEGFDPLGNVPAGETAGIRFYGTGRDPGAQCASVGLLAPPEAPTRYRFDVGGGRTIEGTVPAGQTTVVQVDLPRLAERDFVDVEVDGDAVRVAGINMGCS
jgi:hypothetical protein